MPRISASEAASEPRVRAAIAQAARRTGVDFDYLYNQARIESSLDPQAKARTSSAAGLYQFTRQTWLQVVKAHGSDHGAAWAADAIARAGPSLAVADPQRRLAVDDLRYDPEFAAAMAGEFAADNRAHLEADLGHPVAPVDLYLAHFLGNAGAIDFLRAHDADPDALAAPLFPVAAAANHAVFYSPDGTARSLSEIRARFASELDRASPPGQSAPGLSAPVGMAAEHRSRAVHDRPPLQLASIEPMPHRLSLDYAARAYRRLAEFAA